MKITKEEVMHVANLAHLDMDESSIDTFTFQLGKILEYVDTLNRVDTEGVLPTYHAIALTNAFREDIQKDHFDKEQVLGNAPEKEDGSFIVPKVIQ
ncbi:MAG: Asp-tRNA(Asn)/Glu-tRNA(Gln) amidotransferase subunit GatC [Desulfobacterales bacterium]|nr:Asp-tRNA(Asn)/Glu-tRNA(Gln) amidotransferase subunit GatC [Desulfobacterales bacterium]